VATESSRPMADGQNNSKLNAGHIVRNAPHQPKIQLKNLGQNVLALLRKCRLQSNLRVIGGA
jgi:hypothetical protein